MENNVPRTLFEARKVAGSAKYIQNLKLHSLPLRLFSQCSVLVMFSQLTFSLSDSALAVTSNGAVIPKSLNMNWIIFKKNVTWKQSQNFKGCKNLLPTAEGEVAQPGGHRNKALPGGFKQEITGNAFHPYMTWGWHTGGERHCQWTSVVWQHEAASQPAVLMSLLILRSSAALAPSAPERCCVRYNDCRKRMEGMCEAQNHSWANEQVPLRKLSRRRPFSWRGRWCCYSSPVWCRAAGGSVHIICLNTASFFFPLCWYKLVKGRHVKGSAKSRGTCDVTCYILWLIILNPWH